MFALELDNPFWQFLLVVYSQPGVATECIALQEASGIDVNVLLFCAWLGAERQVVLTDADLALVSDRVRAWHEQIVRPLRGVRRNLKALGGDTSFVEKARSLELEGEQIEQAMLFSLSRDRWHRNCLSHLEEGVRDNVSRLMARSGGAPAGQWPTRLVDASLRQSDKLQPDRKKHE